VESTSPRLSLEYPFPSHTASKVGIGPKVGFVHEEDLGSTILGLLSDLAVLEDEGFPLFILGFQEAFFWPLQDEAQPVEVGAPPMGAAAPLAAERSGEV